MAEHLQKLPVSQLPRPMPARPDPARRALGRQLYAEHCADCHGTRGEGARTADGAWAYPPLAGSRIVAQASAQNLLRVIERGGFGPATPGRPQPFGMPPFAGRFRVDELAALASHLRASLAPGAGEIDSVDVLRLQGLDDPN